jgi:hypothetical protein
MSVHDPGVRRKALLGEVERHRYRLHRLPRLTAELQAVTTQLLRQEILEAASAAMSATEDQDDRPDPLRWWDR